MRKMLVVMAMVALVFSISGGIVVANAESTERFEVVNLDPGQSPPPGKRTIRTVVETIAGFDICYWGRPGLRVEKGSAIQRWEHPNGEVVIYNLFLPDKETAKMVARSCNTPGVLMGMKRQLDDKSLELRKASVGKQIWVDINLPVFLKKINP
jgi:hypothetical protein